MIDTKNVFVFFLSLVPLFLITGPAIPDIVISLCCIYFLLTMFFNFKENNIYNNLFIKITLIFWLLLIFISFFAFNKIKSFQDSFIFIRFLLIPILMYYFFFTNDKVLKRVLLVTLLLVIFVSIDTLFQFINYSSKNGFGSDLLGFKSNWYGRLTGPFGDELVPGAYVSKFGLVGYAYILYDIKLRRKFFLHILYLTTILIVCFASGERMALATYLLGLFILFIFLANRRYTILLSIFFGLFVIFLIHKFHPFYNDFIVLEKSEFHQGLKIEKSFECGKNDNKICKKIITLQPDFITIIKNFKTSAYGEIYNLAFKMFKDNPLSGIGVSNFEYLCINETKYNKEMVNYGCASHPHNSYIQWLTEGGIFVFALFIFYLAIIFILIFKNTGDIEFKIISIVVMTILFWPFMSTGSLIKNWNGVLIFYITGLCLCLSKFKKIS